MADQQEAGGYYQDGYWSWVYSLTLTLDAAYK